MSPFSARKGSSVPRAPSACTIAPPVPSGSDSVIQVIVGSRRRPRKSRNFSSRYALESTDLAHPVTGEVVQDVIEDGAVDERHERLRHRVGEGPQAGPFAADEDDGLHRARARSRSASETTSARIRSTAHATGSSTRRHPCA